jgi:hypothetical protein
MDIVSFRFYLYFRKQQLYLLHLFDFLALMIYRSEYLKYLWLHEKYLCAVVI